MRWSLYGPIAIALEVRNFMRGDISGIYSPLNDRAAFGEYGNGVGSRNQAISEGYYLKQKASFLER